MSIFSEIMKLWITMKSDEIMKDIAQKPLKYIDDLNKLYKIISKRVSHICFRDSRE